MKLKKSVLYLLTLLPISSIAFAANYSFVFENKLQDKADIEKEFLERLADNELPLKYYRFLKDNKIQDSDQLLSDEFAAHKQRLVDEYIRDYKDVLMRVGGTISFG